MDHCFKIIDSPVGRLTLVARGQRLAAILWQNDRPNRVRLGSMTPADNDPVLIKVQSQLEEYFAGQRRHFDIELDFQGTGFQQQVWAALLTIPYGETRTYSQIARQVGNEKAVRAVGAANGRNPISIIAPCHRVIGASGELTGFAGGLDAKQILLGLEGVDCRSSSGGNLDLFGN